LKVLFTGFGVLRYWFHVGKNEKKCRFSRFWTFYTSQYPIFHMRQVKILKFFSQVLEFWGIGFMSGKMKKNVDFLVFGLFIPKKYDLDEEKSVCLAPLPL
jgi:hypothetical protein